MDALKGLRSLLDEAGNVQYSIYILDQRDLEHPTRLMRELSSAKPDMILTIGPEATSMALSLDLDIRLVYTMVLNPDILLADSEEDQFGIALHIPAFNQLKDIRKVFPGLERLGLLFDPGFNSSFYQQIKLQGRIFGLEIIPIEVSSSTQIPAALQGNWQNIDALWLIPDPTISSQALIEHIIKESLYQKKPVVGYNRFFYDSGAAAVFILDFEEIGKQTAKLALNMMHGLPGRQVIPAYEVLVNKRVLQSLELRIREDSQ